MVALASQPPPPPYPVSEIMAAMSLTGSVGARGLGLLVL